MKYIIIGNGIAGVEAAQAIRKNDNEGDITLITKSKHPHYFRPRLVEYLAGKVSLEQIQIFKEDFYQKNRIENIFNTRIDSISREEKTVTDAEGKKYEYDRLLIATGGIPFVPSIEGSSHEGIFTLRGITDSDRILDYCKDLKNVVVVGGGLLGLETANSLAALEKQVTVIEYAPWLLPRQLDEEGGRVLQGMLEEKGLKFYTGINIEKIVEEGKNNKSLLFDTGETIRAEAVIVSAGIRPKLELAEKAGLKVNRGIVVDHHLQSSVENIYAAGDNAEYQGILYGLWPAAKEQGKAAGLNMAGVATEYTGTVMSSQLKITGIDLFSAGDISSTEGDVFVSASGASYLKFLLKDGRPAGVIALGDKEAVKAAKKVMERKIDPGDFTADWF